MSQEEDFARGFIKGFEEGLKGAWEEIIKLSTKGYTSRELQIMAKSKKSMLFQTVQQKAEELERALGTKILTQAPPPAAPAAKADLRPGWSYVVKEERPDKGFSIFASLIGGGARGLCISRTHPDTLKQKYGFEAETIWLTKSETSQGSAGKTGAEFVSPNNLARLASAVREFLSKGESGAVIIEGLEYMTTQNDFKSVLRFVQLINEQVVLDKGYLIIPVDEGTMDPKDFSLVEREMSQVL
ncbi:MAG: hypothetical protein QG582_733 [Candidatus Thermoplasmatota archaeon]|nr:hypothetical protein [Candidatus Thermoplasmatota archaeon]